MLRLLLWLMLRILQGLQQQLLLLLLLTHVMLLLRNQRCWRGCALNHPTFPSSTRSNHENTNLLSEGQGEKAGLVADAAQGSRLGAPNLQTIPGANAVIGPKDVERASL